MSTASKCSATVRGRVEKEAVGGESGWGAAGWGAAIENELIIYDGAYVGEAVGGWQWTAAWQPASKNTVTIYGGTVNGNVSGGRLYTSTHEAADNTVDISGGTIQGNIYGGYAPNGYAKRNTVRISGTPNLSSATLYGGWSPNDAVTGNTLEILNSGISVAGVENFEKLAFTLPATITNGGTMLTASGSANFPAAATKVDISVTGRPALKENDEITLIAAGSLSIKDYPKSLSAGGFDFALRDDGKNLIAKITKVLPASAGNATAVPTMGGIGLLLSSIALAGAAVPALRRRKKQDKKADTHR